MHRQYARDGLVAISVSLDPIDDDDPKVNEKKKAKVLEFLQKEGAAFTNLLLDEEVEFWQGKLRFMAPPCLYVFSRQGKWTQFEKTPIDYDAVDRLVVELLKEK